MNVKLLVIFQRDHFSSDWKSDLSARLLMELSFLPWSSQMAQFLLLGSWGHDSIEVTWVLIFSLEERIFGSSAPKYVRIDQGKSGRDSMGPTFLVIAMVLITSMVGDQAGVGCFPLEIPKTAVKPCLYLKNRWSYELRVPLILTRKYIFYWKFLVFYPFHKQIK